MASSDDNFHEWNQMVAQREATGASVTALLSGQSVAPNPPSKLEQLGATVRCCFTQLIF